MLAIISGFDYSFGNAFHVIVYHHRKMLVIFFNLVAH